MRLKASAINEKHICAVKTLHFCDDACCSAFERCDEPVIDGWICTVMPIASVWALGSAWYSKAAEVPERQPLRYREGEVGKLHWYVIGQRLLVKNRPAARFVCSSTASYLHGAQDDLPAPVSLRWAEPPRWPTASRGSW
jgi:hypothetical protein